MNPKSKYLEADIASRIRAARKKLLELWRTTWHRLRQRAFFESLEEDSPVRQLAINSPCTTFFSRGNFDDPSSYAVLEI